MVCWKWLKSCLCGFKRLSLSGRKGALFAGVLLPAIALLLGFFRFRTVYRLFDKLLPQGEARPVDTEMRDAVLAVFRNAPVGRSCLPQAMTLFFLARRKGWRTDLRLGLAPNEPSFSAHAWVELDGQPVAALNAGIPCPVAFPRPLQDAL